MQRATAVETRPPPRRVIPRSIHSVARQREPPRDSEEAVLRLQLERALDTLGLRTAAKHELEMKRRVMAAFKAEKHGSVMAMRNGGAGGPAETVGVQCSLFGQEQERQRSALAQEYDAKLAAQKEVEELKTQVASMGKELAELTEQLIQTKISAAEMDIRGTELTHEVKQLTTKLEVVELPESAPAGTKGAARKGSGGRRTSFGSDRATTG